MGYEHTVSLECCIGRLSSRALCWPAFKLCRTV